MSDSTQAAKAADALKAAEALVAQVKNEAQLDQLKQALVESDNRFDAIISRWLINAERDVSLSLTKIASEHVAKIEILRRAVKLQTAVCDAGRQSQ